MWWCEVRLGLWLAGFTMSCFSLLEPLFMSKLTTSECPLEEAHMRAVLPYWHNKRKLRWDEIRSMAGWLAGLTLVCICMLAPLLMSKLTTSECPLVAAAMRAVSPFWHNKRDVRWDNVRLDYVYGCLVLQCLVFLWSSWRYLHIFDHLTFITAF